MQGGLFDRASDGTQPLAARLRPRGLADYVGQSHLVGPDKPLRRAVESGQLHSMILWGPPGVGKTTFARLLSENTGIHFETLSAVLAGVKDIRLAVEQARNRRAQFGQDTLLFVDEVHRFNKAQQDAFLPHIEDGTILFVGATTENPSFELNSALLSRTRVYVLKPLAPQELQQLIQRALEAPEGLAGRISLDEGVEQVLVAAADGDARRALNILEVASDLAEPTEEGGLITRDVMQQVLQTSLRRFDKGGDVFYDQISALHKAVRGSDADASLYWLCRMLDGGCDPLYLARRLLRIASEDIGNADPRALAMCRDAWDVLERLGSPEGELALAQASVYLALAPKSNAVYNAYNSWRAAIREQPDYPVPVHLRNAPTALLKDMGHGAEYRCAHDEPNAFAAGESYLPEELHGTRFYQPSGRGLEAKMAEKQAYLDKLNAESPKQRYPSDR